MIGLCTALGGCIYAPVSQSHPGTAASLSGPSGVPGTAEGRGAGPASSLENAMGHLHARFAQGRAAVTPLLRGRLLASQSQDFAVDLNTACYTFIAVGGANAADLDLFLFDPGGSLVGQDQATDNFPIVLFCPPSAGTYRLQAKMYSGEGEFGLQAFSTATDPAPTRPGPVVTAPPGTPTPPGQAPFQPPPGTPRRPADPPQPPSAGSEDFLRSRMQDVHGRFGQGRVAITQLITGALAQSQRREFTVELPRGRCFTAIAVGTPPMTDLDMTVFDTTGAELGRDQASDNFPVVQGCAREAGTYRVDLEAYAGSGDYAVQVFGEVAASSEI